MAEQNNTAQRGDIVLPLTRKLGIEPPLISIIVPVYKVEAYLAECLESILKQTYSNLEIILVDDGSPDRSGAICDEYARKDSRVKAYHKENGGVSSSRNYGLSVAHGDWIGFADPDDWIDPDMFEKMLAAALETNADMAICGYIFEYTTGPQKVRDWERRLLVGRDEIAKAYFKEKFFKDFLWSKLTRRSFFENGLQFPLGMLYEDAVVTDELLQHTEVIICLPDCFYHYRKRASSIVQTRSVQNEMDFWDSRMHRFELLKDQLPACRQDMISDQCMGVRRAWRVLASNKNDPAAPVLAEKVNRFAKEYIGEILRGSYKKTFKFIVFMAQFNNRFSYRVVDALNRLWVRSKHETEDRDADNLFP